MSCILRIIGKDFDVDRFILKSGITTYRVFHKGESRLKNKPDGEKYEFSGCAIDVSSAGFNKFDKQVEDAIECLKLNHENLKLIPSTPEIQFAVLDFGIEYNADNFVQSKHFPINLLNLCAELGISVELSIYPQTTDHEI